MTAAPGPIVPFEPIEGPLVWTAPELAARDDWIHDFDDAEVGEIEAALGAVRGRGIEITNIVRNDFSLPRLGARLAAWRRELVEGPGVRLARGLPVERWSPWERAAAYWGLGLHIGDPVSQNRDGHVLGHVKDIGGAFNDMNDRAGYKSRARLPFHTDVGADVVGLLCLEQGTSGGRSHVANALALHNAMLEEDPEMVRLLSVPLHRDRRGEHLPGKGPTYRAPVFAYHAGYMTVTYVRRFIDSAPRHPGVAPLSAETIAALDRLEALCESDTLRLDMEFRPGDIQWINNLVTFHGRGEFADGARQKRHLLRLWLQIPEGWPLPDCHYERFGEAGDPGRPRGLLPPGTPLVAPLDVE